MSDVKFAVGGAVQIKHGTYLPRPADEKLFSACQAGDFSYVLACRQIGKSSLMHETARRLSETGIRTVIVDLNSIGQGVTAEQWYFSLVLEVARRLQLALDVDAWWESRPRLSADLARFQEFFRDVILQEIEAPIVIFIDEIDVTLKLPFTDDFFAAIRTIYNDRAQETAYDRLTFVLLGVATPDELIKDNTRTPFNIGREISLRDFTETECHPFREAIETAYPEQGSDYFDQIYDWTNGHPYLTQKLCQALLESKVETDPNLVTTLVDELFLAPEARGDDNLQFVQGRVTSDAYAQTMLRLYKDIWQGSKPVADNEQSPAINRLKLYGLVIVKDGHLAVRNKLYREAFDGTWAESMLKSLEEGLPNDYNILKRIGQRDFVSVYLAEPQGTNGDELVALKLLHLPEEAEHALIEGLDRVAHKAQVVAEAEHPHIVSILDIGRIDERRLYITMRYIAGGSLHVRLKDGPLPRNEAIAIIEQIGAALTHSHQLDIYHLGVNSRDILFDSDQEAPCPMLTDFGFARLLPQELSSQLHHDYLMLTPHYVAPELKEQQASAASVDVYGLAVTFFEMLAGQLPPERQPGQPLPPLSTVNPAVGDLFDELLTKATAIDPLQRYQSVADFLEAIQQVRQQEVAELISVAEHYVELGKSDPAIALAMIEDIFEVYPDHPDALRLRGRIQLKQQHFYEALEDYRLAYESVGRDPLSEAGRDYLTALGRSADTAWAEEAYSEAVPHYETIQHILADKSVDNDLEAIGHTAQVRLVEYYYRAGVEAYNAENSAKIESAIFALKNIRDTSKIDDLKEKLRALEIKKWYESGLAAYKSENIETLKKAIKVLEERGAAAESQELQQKFQALQVRAQLAIINENETQIKQIEALGQPTEENLTHLYAAIDHAYKHLVTLEPNKTEWVTRRHQKLREQAEWQKRFAINAEEELHFEQAMRHYQTIRNIKETIYPNVDRELNIDLTGKIKELEEKINYDHKYRAVQDLIRDGDHLGALNQLDQDFIKVGNYEHRNVPQLFWALIYAKRHEGTFPTGWNKDSLHLEIDRLVGTELATSKAGDKQDIQKQIETLQKQVAANQEELAQKEAALTEAQTQLGEAQQRATDLEQTLEEEKAQSNQLKREVSRLKRNGDSSPDDLSPYERLHRLFIPFALVAAVLAGGVLLPQFQTGEFPSALAVVGLVGLIGYTGYYLWLYYYNKG